MADAVIVAAARSPIGRAFKGSLKDLRPDNLTATIVRAALDPAARRLVQALGHVRRLERTLSNDETARGVIGGVDPFKLACKFPTVYFGRHLKIREVEYFQAARLRVETERPVDVYADGEYVCHTPVEVSLQRGALRIIVRAPAASY